MRIVAQIANWLETHWVAPAYAGWLLGCLAVFFFGAATNTMAGWLYVISGVSLAMLAIAAVLPARSILQFKVRRRPIQPVSVGDQLTIELEIENLAAQPKTLLQVQDNIPFVLGKPIQSVIETIPSHGVYLWVYYQPTPRRGVYRWEEVDLRTASPLGLFWCRRRQRAKATAIVYPTVLPLRRCPLIDKMGAEDSPLTYSDRRAQMATEGITRTLRPYRFGDPTRLIHWRSSARYGELRVRELEVSTGGQEIIIGLDSAATWELEDFEQAVITAASLYFYATRSQLNVKVWTAATGLVSGNRVVLETLAATSAGEDAAPPLHGGVGGGSSEPPALPLIWLTQNPVSVNFLKAGSRWILWAAGKSGGENKPLNRDRPGIEIHPERPLQNQLEAPVR